MDKQAWQAWFIVEGLTQDEINELLVAIIEKVESFGGLVGGGFGPAEVEEQEDEQA